MWTIGLSCDGCDERIDMSDVRSTVAASDEDFPDFREARAVALRGLPKGLPKGVRAYMASLGAVRILTRLVARRRRWEQVASFDDGEEWYCPTCRLARDRETLLPDIGRGTARR
jgi:hypothetical protein